MAMKGPQVSSAVHKRLEAYGTGKQDPNGEIRSNSRPDLKEAAFRCPPKAYRTERTTPP